MTTTSLIALTAALAICTSAAASTHARFYVATSGSDAWSGTLAEPNRTHTDGPFATIERARLAVRSVKGKSPVTVLIRDGVYYLDNTLIFEPEDSGTPDSPITYAAYPGEKPIISGGVPVKSMKRDASGRWHANLPEVREGKWGFLSIYVNGERSYRPRLPKQGGYRIAAETPLGSDEKPSAFEFPRATIRSDWANLSDVEVLTVHLWSLSRMRIKSVDDAARIVRFTGTTWANASFASFTAGYPFYVENVKEALGEPGEFYLDRPTGELTYIPKHGESLTKAEIVLPRLERIVHIKGNPAEGKLVTNVIFRDLTFAHSNWYTPAAGWEFPQSDADTPGAILAEGTQHCRFESCNIERTGAYGIELGAGCKFNEIEDCELTDLGAGGIKIGFWAPQEPEALTVSHNLVRNNLIAHGGRVLPGGTGVMIGASHHNRVANNTIFDLYYMGVSAGYNWDEGTTAHHNIIENNHIFGLGQGSLSDMGAIYTLGVSPGTIIRHNLIHDVKSLYYGGWGVYLDAKSSEITVQDNIIYRADGGAFHANCGHSNQVTNNIFALGDEQQMVRSGPNAKPSFAIENNIICYRDSVLLGSDWDGGKLTVDHNLYWDTAGAVKPGVATWDEWLARGHDQHSIIADPLFADPDKGDFTLAPNSPALKLGFRPISMGGFGRSVRSPYRTRPERSPATTDMSFYPRAFPDLSEQQPISEDFENLKPGSKLPGAALAEGNATATIRITGEVAASGKHSLRFIDDGKQINPWDPSIILSYKCIKGTVRESFAIRLEPGAAFAHEWRDTVMMDKPGPSIKIDPSGSLAAGGVELCKVAPGKWVRISIACQIGAHAPGTYDLTVQVEGQRAKTYPAIKHHPLFHKLMWLGFMADGPGPGVLYLDDLSLQTRGR